MNIKDEIYRLLRERGCLLFEEAGILNIQDPDGVEWDMTIPMRCDDPSRHAPPPEPPIKES